MNNQVQQSRTRQSITVIVAMVIGTAMVIGVWWYVRSTELETNDAQVDGHIYPVSARIAGTVRWVNPKAEDTFTVESGAPLVTLDSDDYTPTVAKLQAEIASRESDVRMESLNVPVTEAEVTGMLAERRAAVEEAEAEVSSRIATADAMKAHLEAARASFARADTDHRRYLSLVSAHEISRSEYDRHNTEALTAQQAVDAGIADLDGAERAVEVARQQVAERKAQVVAALPTSQKVESAQAKTLSTRASLGAVQAELKRAELDLSYTQIAAPIGGVVGKRNVENGQRVAVGDLLMTITPLEDLWVTANYKETQLRKVRVGDPVTIHLDTYGKDLKGTVQSIGGTTGAKESALAPENATGNFVKVVQRIPVRIRLDGYSEKDFPIVPGMSVETTIHPRD
jgi:membrane fusion protein (multidrug efflux system)